MVCRIKYLDIVDFAILQMVIVILAFKDYGSIAIITQCMAFGMICLELALNRESTIHPSCIKYIIYKMIFILWCLLSSLWAVYPNVVISEVTTLGLRAITGLTLILYMNTQVRRRKLISFMAVAGMILCLRLLIVVPITQWGNRGIGNYLAHDRNNSYGNTGITYVLGVISVYLLTDSRVLGKKVSYSLATIFTIISLFTGSKKQLIFLIVTMLLLGILESNNISKLLKNLGCIAILIGAVLFLIFKVDLLYNVLGQRIIAFFSFFTSVGAESDASTITRSQFLKAAWQVFLQHPIVGIGLDGFRYVNPYQRTWSENNIVELMADIGIIGAILYYTVPVHIIHSVMKRIRMRDSRDIQILIAMVCLIFIDITMVSYANSTLQFHLAFVFALNQCRH